MKNHYTRIQFLNVTTKTTTNNAYVLPFLFFQEVVFTFQICFLILPYKKAKTFNFVLTFHEVIMKSNALIV